MEQWERSWQQICAMKKEDYILIDIRDELSFSYGNIPGSINITEEMLLADAEKWREKTVVLCCKKAVLLLQHVCAKPDGMHTVCREDISHG